MRIDSITVRAVAGGRSCHVHCDKQHFSFPFTDLWEFDSYIAELLMLTEGLVAPHAITNADRERLQISEMYIEDAGERNKHCIAAREVTERRAEGAKLCGGSWYAEITINDVPNDCSFTTLEELYQVTQQIIRRECRGVLITGTAPAHALAAANG